jgi:hypothetical protein
VASTIHFAGDGDLFVLENGGILFSESRQELYTCNEPATFIWCCLEEHLSPQEIATAYASAFQISQAEAARLVIDVLQQWQGLGYILGLDVPATSEIDLITALGRLLTNPALRKDFETSALKTADQLSVRASDREAFLRLSPEALELQARALENRKLARRHGVTEKGENAVLLSLSPNQLQDAASARLTNLSSHWVQRHYRLLTTTFRIRFATRAQDEIVHPTLAHLEIPEPPEIDVMLDLLELESGHVVMEDLVPLGHCIRLEQLAPIAKKSVRQLATGRYPYFLQIHAGVLCDGEKCLLLPGASGSGKTTLTAALARSGFQYLSDEIALLEEDTMHVSPLPISLTVKQDGVDVLAPFYPELPDLPSHKREDHHIVRYLAPVSTPVSLPLKTYPIGWIIFPRFSPHAATLLRPLNKAEALHRLMGECLLLPEPLTKRKVRNMVQWMREIQCFDLPMASLGEAVELVRRLCL